MSASGDALGPSRREVRPLRSLLIIAGLTGVAISQPLLSILGEAPATLAFHGVQGAELVLVAAVVALGPVLLLGLPVALVLRWWPGAGQVAHLAVVALLAGAAAVQVAKSVGVGSTVGLGVLAASAGLAIAAAQHRWTGVALWGAALAVLPLLAATVFVLGSPASDLLQTAPEGPAREDRSDLPSVVLLVLDELPTRSILAPDGTIDASRFPHLAALAADGTWYRHHTTVATKTAAAVPSLLTGRLPATVPPLWTSHPDSLFSLLAPTHDLEVVETVTSLCPYTSCGLEGDAPGGPGLRDLATTTIDLWFERVRLGPERPLALDDFEESTGLVAAPVPETPEIDEDAPGAAVDRAVEATSARTQALVASLDRATAPALWFLHLVLPHQPWERWPDGTRYTAAPALGTGLPDVDGDELRYSWSEWTAAVSEQRHLLQAEYADQLVGAVLDQLRVEGLYDESLVVLVSDHGVSFEPGSSAREVERSTVDAIAYTPLIVKPPGQQDGRVDDSNLEIIDVLPTMADILGVDLPWDTDGAEAGSSSIASRGPDKVIYDLGPFLEPLDVIEFDDTEAFTAVGERSIRGPRDPDDPLSGLSSLLGVDDLLGQPLDADPGQRQAQVDALDQLRRPPDGEPPLALVTGVVADAPGDAIVLVAVDGIVQGGSRLSQDSDGTGGRFAVLLPQGALDTENDVDVALVVDGRAEGLTVVPR